MPLTTATIVPINMNGVTACLTRDGNPVLRPLSDAPYGERGERVAVADAVCLVHHHVPIVHRHAYTKKHTREYMHTRGA